MDKLMELIITMRMEDQKKEREREEKKEVENLEREERREKDIREQADRELRQERIREEREQKREEERERREERLLTTLKEAQPAVPQQVNIQTHKLPEMKDGDDMEIFVTTFESALLSNLVPENQ